MVARPEAERQRDHCNEHHRQNDLARTGSELASSVEAADPEDEHRDHREKRKPVALRLPEDSPQWRPLPEIELAEDERHEDPEDEPREVEYHEGGDTGEAAGDGQERGAREEVGPGRTDVFDRRRPGLGRHGWLRAHPPECTSGTSRGS